jgi:hypothetical protein
MGRRPLLRVRPVQQDLAGQHTHRPRPPRDVTVTTPEQRTNPDTDVIHRYVGEARGLDGTDLVLVEYPDDPTVRGYILRSLWDTWSTE